MNEALLRGLGVGTVLAQRTGLFALAIVLGLYRNFKTVNVDEMSEMNG